MPQSPLFSEYPFPSRPRTMQAALAAGRAERSRAAAGLAHRMVEAVRDALRRRRRQTVAVPPSGIHVVVCNDC